MNAINTRKSASWRDVKAKLVHFDHASLVELVHDLYTSNKANEVFLHTRFGLGEDVLEPYKVAINRWLWPDLRRTRNASVAEAKKAIASYKNSIGQSAGLAELMVFYCERASGFSAEVGLQDEAYFGALVKMFERALQTLSGLDEPQRLPLLKRLHAVHQISQRIGYDVDDAMSDLLVEYGFDVDRP